MTDLLFKDLQAFTKGYLRQTSALGEWQKSPISSQAPNMYNFCWVGRLFYLVILTIYSQPIFTLHQVLLSLSGYYWIVNKAVFASVML